MAEKPDYYTVLGVPKTASLEEIKKAFKSITMKYHPDMVRNKSEADQKKAAEIFQPAKEASEVLTDATKRATYDKFGHQGLENVKNGSGNSQSYTDAAGPVKLKTWSETDTFSFFEKKSSGNGNNSSVGSDGLTADERRQKNAEERRKNRGTANGNTPSTKETFNETAEKLGDAAEQLKDANLSVDDLQRIRDKAADLIREVDAAIVRARKNNGPKP
ncbi:MAG: DnaJ domain-containing protein [Alphaproteobacteria bacterium]|nr:DnaJ domain-containing protein [Alphaproteobacteria bacterium]